MALNKEWLSRLESWRKVMPTLLYQPCENVEFEGYFTKAKLSPAEAAKGPFRKLKPGMAWGRHWEYGWFRARLRAPKSCGGQRLVLRGKLGGDATVFVDGKLRGTFDH